MSGNSQIKNPKSQRAPVIQGTSVDRWDLGSGSLDFPPDKRSNSHSGVRIGRVNRWAVLPFLLLLPALSRAGDEPSPEFRKPVKLTLESFKLAVREAKGFEEKASLLHAFGTTAVADAPSLSEVSRYLGALSGDIRLLLPTTAISILARFRGNRIASQNLIQALPAFKKSPYLQKKILGALTQIAHESAIP